ncbi:MAG: hypothetical protein ABI180_17105 [Microcoleus sp.]|jgi:hypothetical protein
MGVETQHKFTHTIILSGKLRRLQFLSYYPFTHDPKAKEEWTLGKEELNNF